MNQAIFRKAALERLSSPDRLDEMLVVASTKRWLALLGLLLLVALAAIWGYTSAIPTTVDGQGVIVRAGGVSNVVAQSSGMVVTLDAAVGRHVSANQVVATIAQPELLQRIKAVTAELAETRLMLQQTSGIQQSASKLQLEALARKRANAERSIEVLESQKKLLVQQIEVADKMFAKGLITQQQTIELREKASSLDGHVGAARAEIKQLDAEQFTLETNPAKSITELQFQVSDRERKLAALDAELKLASRVTSPYSGQVIELKLQHGSPVSPGTPMLSIQPDATGMEFLLFVPSVRAKDVHKEMDAEVSPSHVRREEFGFIRGKVSYVADYPSTEAALMQYFSNESLVKAILSSGPVTEVRVELHRDPGTPSGYRWSSSMGPRMPITSGTLCSTRIVTRRQRPVEMVFPALRDTLGVE